MIRSNPARPVLVLVFALALLACRTPTPTPTPEAESLRLAAALRALSPRVEDADARAMAEAALRISADLRQEYGMIRPAVGHNLLVRLGVRARGLCCHWAEDLRRRLAAIQAPSLALSWAVAHRGSWLREHNSVVLHPSESDWREGLVFDPWRNSGTPTWAPAAADRYPWALHPLSGHWDELRCRSDLSRNTVR